MNPKIAANFGRLLLLTGIIALLGAWYTQIIGTNLLGMSQTHLYMDAIILSLLGTAGLVDAQLHLKNV